MPHRISASARWMRGCPAMLRVWRSDQARRVAAGWSDDAEKQQVDARRSRIADGKGYALVVARADILSLEQVGGERAHVG
jgi:hypothetical protein